MPVAGGGPDTRGLLRREPLRCQAGVGTADRPACSCAVGTITTPLRKAPLTATVGAAMLLISLYVRRILTASREPASQAPSGAR